MKNLIVFAMIGFLLHLLGCAGQEKKSTSKSDDHTTKSTEDTISIRGVLTLDQISKMEDEALEQAIFDNISINMESGFHDGRESVQSLSSGKRAVYVTWVVEGEVNNGGFNQFYYNASGKLADMGEESFKTIGAMKHATLMREANVVYEKIKGRLEKFNDGTIESFSKSYEGNPLNELDDKFYDLEESEPIGQLRINFIRAHAQEFVTTP